MVDAFHSFIHMYNPANGSNHGSEAAAAPARVASGTSSNNFLQLSHIFPGFRVFPPRLRLLIVIKSKPIGGYSGGVRVTKLSINSLRCVAVKAGNRVWN